MRWMAIPLATAVILAVPVYAQQAGNVDVRVVNYDGLKQIIRDNLGKVVWVDFWMISCGPCKKQFPHVIDMHRKHTREGLVVITVCTDSPESRPQVVSYLNGINANCINVILDDPANADVFDKKLRVTSFPTYYVFDRQGKWAQFTDDINYDAVDRLLVQLLNEK